ncbi:MAG: DUF2256 and DUF3253 domain-containing protein [Ornithinimicrobium sp.]
MPASRSASAREHKTCVSCGRRIEWRKKWERDWDQVRYCSSGCRRRGVADVDRQLEEAIVQLLSTRAPAATICPSEAARAVATEAASGSGEATSDEAWRELMEPVGRAARRLVAAGEVEIAQKGQVVDPSTARGPIRIRRKR